MYELHENLTDSQWQVIKNIVDDGRKRKVCLKRVVDACLWLTRTGSQWRNLSQTHYPVWQTVAYYFYKWQDNGVWQQVRAMLVKKERERQGRQAEPSRVAIDSQSVKQCGCFSEQVGVDGNKKIDGRKRHLAVDNLGLPWAVYVGAANESDAVAGFELLPQLKSCRRLSLICADAAYKGEFVSYAYYYGWKVDISQKPPSKQGFIPQKGRWQVERSGPATSVHRLHAWLNHYRRLAKDYERTPASAVCFIELAFINIILSKIP
ncbi:IS5 family transposase [Rhodocytophaga rosea]|uniref:IS5 family transposase n=1 Tax=Rhodocytophaga rosea TaxID=2704465 RepID=A0A6C0GHU8_9BACT|nr:IS5 family transposase [Rhodocytophaga rosea]QHT67290.1 IS5 family transposase [Rhodocytophaga rosea]QHT71751.1 IS5 family transposase [Rhodocytophaga rosea]